jgi:ABC-type spermidine/putrescine transport system permease subunit I
MELVIWLISLVNILTYFILPFTIFAMYSILEKIRDDLENTRKTLEDIKNNTSQKV